MTERRRAFTLVELLVAIALGTILIGVVVFVWMQSTRIFSSTVNNLESYQRLRTVLDLIERDLANTNRTIDMEPYLDTNGNGHFDAGVENLLKHVDPAVGPQAASSAATSFRQPTHPNDPLLGKPEFCEDDNGDNGGFSNTPYFFAPVLFSPPPYAITGDGYLEGRHYWRDEVYVRTFASARGTSVPAMVHYRLVQGSDGRSSIRRRMWFTDEAGGVVSPTTSDPTRATDQFALLASGLCDLKFGFFFKEAAASGAGGSSSEGVWYHVGCPVSSDSGKLLNADEQRGFRTATAPSGAISTQHANRAQFKKAPTPAGANAISFVYEGNGRIENTDGFPPLFRTITNIDDDAPTSPGSLATYTNFDFPGVRPGDKMYLYDAQDDDASSIDPDGGGPATADAANYLDPSDPTKSIIRFPDAIYTVDEIISQRDPNNTNPQNFYISMKMREPINFYQLGRRWLIGPSPGVGEPVYTVQPGDMGKLAGPARTIRGAFNVKYRVAFLPPAFLVRLSIDDRYNKQVHQIERVIRILQH